jgi:alpha-L-fucosidase 2
MILGTFTTAALADSLVVTFKDGSRQTIPLNQASGQISAIQFVSGGGASAGTVTTVPANTNLALRKTATQSSTGYGGDPGRAVDGNTDGHYFNGKSVSHTNSEQGAWWQVDLGASYPIGLIRIWNRTDCCGERLSNFRVLVSDVPFVSGDLNAVINQPGVWHYAVSGAAGVQTDIPVARAGRYVRIQLAGQNYLQLAEVQVFSN